MQNKYDILLNKDNSSEINEIIKDYYLEGEEVSLTYLPNVNDINIIIGSNNSGKSRFMRYLMQCNNLVGVQNLNKVNEIIKEYNHKVELLNETQILGPKRKYESSGTYVIGVDHNLKRLNFLAENRLSEIKLDYLNLFNEINENKNRFEKLKTKLVSDHYFDNFNDIHESTVKNFSNVKNYYIPTLRSAHSLFRKDGDSFSKLEEDIYLQTLERYYKFHNSKVEIFTGLHLYKEILNSRNSKRSIRQSFEKFEKFIGDNFFGKKQVDIVAEFNKDDNLANKNYSEIISVHFGEENETRKLYQLGDGIQAIIILMYKIFMAENNSFIFIDEPELNLHPGMQRLFLDQISTNQFLKKKKLKYFISTHSNHFLDLTLEKENISIYSFTSNSIVDKDNTFTIRNVNAGDNSVLKNIGVNNSSVFLANCGIWVEGISDRNYIKAFLKSYIDFLGKDAQILKEDIDYAFFEYAGSNVEHYLFEDISEFDSKKLISDINALALNNRIFLLADSDNAKKSSKKGMRLKEFEDLKRDNFFPYIIWNVREIENLITKDMWKDTLISLCNKDLVKKHEKDIKEKIENAINEVDLSAYSKHYIGKFLNVISQKLNKLEGKNILNESSYEKKTDGFGTLIPKRELSELVLEKNFPWEAFAKNDEIVKLTESIYNFIISSKS